MRRLFFAVFSGVMMFWSWPASAQSVPLRTLKDHVPSVISQFHLQPLEKLPTTNQLNLAISLPLRNRNEVGSFLESLEDPSSTNYHHYLTPEQFTEKFGPTEEDYQKIIAFAKRNGLTVKQTYPNRTLVDVSGNAGTVEKAFHVTLNVYQHPTENRKFYAPNAEPSVPTNVPVLDISGLDNYRRPKPLLFKKNENVGGPISAGTGSGTGGTFFGNDFRAAYLPDTTLTGEGQTVGLVEFDGYYANDITNYETHANQPIVPLQNVLLDGFSGTPTSDDLAVGEVSLDIEMALAMAPCLSKIVVFEGSPNNFLPNDVLASMVTNSQIKSLSSSWGWNGGPSAATDNYLLQMRMQGQSYFNAVGDSDAFPPGYLDDSSNTTVPSSSTNAIQVGGTTLTTTGPGGAWSSETVWNWGGGQGSSGGISSFYSIPDWQTNIDMTANHGSTVNRNVPDVALTADNVDVIYNNGKEGDFGGTSCAAPLWAGVTALMNQQAVAAGNGVAGFLDPAIYAIGQSNIYTANFHDITTGNNFWSGSPTNFPAVTGYDLCTGWGTPAGQTLINTLAGTPDSFGILPTTNLFASGISGQTFAPTSQNISLTNSGNASLDWSLTNVPSWLNVSPTNGTLPSGSQITLDLTLNSSVTNLAAGYYFADLLFTNFSSHGWQVRRLTLQVSSPFSITPATGFNSVGPAGGPFSTTAKTFSLKNIGAIPLAWSLINTSVWLTASVNSGTLAGGAMSNVTVSLADAATNLPDGIYTATVTFTNQLSHDAQNPSFQLLVGLVKNGGFETGDFTGWTLNGDAGSYDFVDSNGGYTGFTSHSGSYFAALGEAGSLAYLSQNISATIGQNYLLSLWLSNPTGITPTEFSVSWNGTILYDQVNLGAMNWTNLQFIVTGTANSSTLKIGGRDDYNYLGLDDITLTPIAPVAFQATTTTTNDNLKFSWNSTTGLVYQVQYKTNLLQPSWIVLKSISATNTTTIFTDTNPISTAPQKFYRLELLP